MRFVPAALVCCVSALFCADVLGQVPPGWGVYSRIFAPTNPPTNPAGLTAFFPYNGISLGRPGAPFRAIASIPLPLAGSTVTGGANSVLVRDADGSVLVGEVRTTPGPVAIYDLTLTGLAVTTSRSFSLGATIPLAPPFPYLGAGVDQMAWLSNGKVLFCHRQVSGPPSTPLPPQGLAILDPVTGTITSVSFPWPVTTGVLNAATANRSGTIAYVGVNSSRFDIYSVPLPGGGTATRVNRQPIPDGIYQLDTDHTGLVYVSTFNQGLYSVDPATGVVSPVLNFVRQLNAMTVDRVSGDIVHARVTYLSPPSGLPSAMTRWSPTSGSPIVVPIPGMPGSDAATGVAIRSSMITVGQQPFCPVAYNWVTAPNPGGPPLLGNAGFSLSLTGTGTPFASGMLLSTRLASPPIPTPIACVKLLLAQPYIAMPMSGLTFPLPLPRNTVLWGLTLNAQVAILDSSAGIVSTPALSFTLL